MPRFRSGTVASGKNESAVRLAFHEMFSDEVPCQFTAATATFAPTAARDESDFRLGAGLCAVKLVYLGPDRLWVRHGGPLRRPGSCCVTRNQNPFQ